MIQQLKDKLEGTEQSLQHQLLQLQVETIFNFSWPLQLNYFVNNGNEVVPVVVEFKKFNSSTS